MANKIFNDSKIKLQGLTANCISKSGTELSSPDQALTELGYSKQPAALRPKLIRGSIQKAHSGMIQDPAGVAVGVNQKPVDQPVGGASAVIYAAFPDLDPIPSMPPGASVLNSSTGAGRRVLHTYSPQLHGSPLKAADCQQALEDLANAYANAFSAANDPPAALSGTGDETLFNLVPISGKIFAGSLKDLVLDHLHPSYTLIAIAIAQASLVTLKVSILPTTLYYYDQPVYTAATAVIDQVYDT